MFFDWSDVKACVHVSQLIDHPEQAVPAGGSFVLQLVVIEQQKGT